MPTLVIAGAAVAVVVVGAAVGLGLEAAIRCAAVVHMKRGPPKFSAPCVHASGDGATFPPTMELPVHDSAPLTVFIFGFGTERGMSA